MAQLERTSIARGPPLRASCSTTTSLRQCVPGVDLPRSTRKSKHAILGVPPLARDPVFLGQVQFLGGKQESWNRCCLGRGNPHSDDASRRRIPKIHSTSRSHPLGRHLKEQPEASSSFGSTDKLDGARTIGATTTTAIDGGATPSIAHRRMGTERTVEEPKPAEKTEWYRRPTRARWWWREMGGQVLVAATGVRAQRVCEVSPKSALVFLLLLRTRRLIVGAPPAVHWDLGTHFDGVGVEHRHGWMPVYVSR